MIEKLEEIYDVITKYINRERSDRTAEGLSRQTDLIDDGILDSLFLIQFVTFLECEFGISLGADLVTPENFSSIESVGLLVQAQLSAPARLDR